MLRIGVDVGGTKIEAIALVGSEERARLRIPTPRDDYDATLAAVCRLVLALETRVGESGSVGVGIPGTISPGSGAVKNANSVWLIGRSLRADLEAQLGREIRIANDANCFAVSEAADGAAAGAAVVFGVIVGTGTGAGIVVGGSILTGPNAIAGEWGHNPLPWPEPDEHPGPRCYCGKQGCIETFLSGPGLERDYERSTGRKLPGARIGAAEEAEPVLARYEHRMARALASVINVLDPDVVVLGGGMSNLERLYENVPRLWAQWVFGATRATGADAFEPVRTRLVRARHGDSSGVRGAAWLWPDVTVRRPQPSPLRPPHAAG
jgi:fructokinase